MAYSQNNNPIMDNPITKPSKPWHRVIKDDINMVGACIMYYEHELQHAHEEFRLNNMNIQWAATHLPYFSHYRETQYREIEMVVEQLEILHAEKVKKTYHKYIEAYHRKLSTTDIKVYVEGDADIINSKNIILEIAAIRNQFLTIVKKYDSIGWSLKNLVEIRKAGLEGTML